MGSEIGSDWPPRMKVVDDEAVLPRRVTAMLILHVRVVAGEFIMAVRDRFGIGDGPYSECDRRPDCRKHRQPPERGGLAEAGTDLAGERIGDQPAAVAQRKLGCERAGRSSLLADRFSRRPDGVTLAE